jgi:hypothetical protein
MTCSLMILTMLVGGEPSASREGYDSEPRELGPKHAKDTHDVFIHLKGVPLCFLQGSRGVGGPQTKALSDW